MWLAGFVTAVATRSPAHPPDGTPHHSKITNPARHHPANRVQTQALSQAHQDRETSRLVQNLWIHRSERRGEVEKDFCGRNRGLPWRSKALVCFHYVSLRSGFGVRWRSWPSRAAASGMDREAEEETIVELSATTTTPRDARLADAQQAEDLRDMP